LNGRGKKAVADSKDADGSEQTMRSPVQTKTETQMLAAIALFCYSVSLAALFASAYSLIALALNVAGQQIGAIYSPHGL
jgi:hypothetical protein